MRCLAKDPADRYATAEALGASLYPFAHARDNAPAAAENVSTTQQLVQRSQAWVVARMKALNSTLEEFSQRAPVTLKTFLNSKAMWSNRPMQQKDLYVAGAAAVALIALVPIARAWRNHSHPLATVTASVTSSTAAGASQSPIQSPEVARAASQSPIVSNASVINVSGTPAPAPILLTVDSDAANPVVSSVQADEAMETPLVAKQAFDLHPVRISKPQPARNSGSKSSAALKNSLPVTSSSLLAIPAPMKAPVPVPAPVAHTTLRIDIQSGVTDQTLEIYSGDELLLTAPLQSAHLGDTLRFNCPITAGEHALRVVLYRADKTVFMHKENNSELHADGTNTMEVKVNRKSKMLLKHETSLEVVWPSSTASSSLLSSPGFKPAGGLALR
jgi:hypothetical protein